MRIKVIKDGKYRQGQVINLPISKAIALIGSGEAIYTKDMVNTDFNTKTPHRGNMKVKHG